MSFLSTTTEQPSSYMSRSPLKKQPSKTANKASTMKGMLQQYFDNIYQGHNNLVAEIAELYCKTKGLTPKRLGNIIDNVASEPRSSNTKIKRLNKELKIETRNSNSLSWKDKTQLERLTKYLDEHYHLSPKAAWK